jgi:hypothetical protein
MGNPNIKNQEHKFVEWSKGTTNHNYDLLKIVDIIAKRFAGKPIIALDVGGGVGIVAQAICESLNNVNIDVIDNSYLAKINFVKSPRQKLLFENFFDFLPNQKYNVVILRTVLHHFVGKSEKETAKLQIKALKKIYSQVLADDGILFVVENFYEPLFGVDLTGRIIFEATSLKGPEKIFRKLGANTAGEGVRFRSIKKWTEMFAHCGYILEDDNVRQDWGMPLWQRIPFFCKRRFQGLMILKK